MVERRFLFLLGIFVAAWAFIAAAFISVVDPYGVSPLKLELPHFNELKPNSVDLDRLIKPYEVWRDQPKTIFLGTSRINESIDPSMLEATRFWPAYNAAIPASEMGDTVADLEQYFRLDPKLKKVFIEAFFYNFARPVLPGRLKTLPDFITSTTGLLFSADALFRAVQTIAFNASGQASGAHTTPRGEWIPPSWLNTAETFNAKIYIETIIRLHRNIPDMQLQKSGFDALDQIAKLCKKHDADLFILITPNYPWDDYRLLSLGYWDRVEDFYRRLSSYPNVVSFSQYNAILTETAGADMKSWYDPIHFSNNTGRLMLRAFLGDKGADIPENFMRPITPLTFSAALAERRSGLDRWIIDNPDFVDAFNAAKIVASTAH
jgi:hypothetical protein